MKKKSMRTPSPSLRKRYRVTKWPGVALWTWTIVEASIRLLPGRIVCRCLTEAMARRICRLLNVPRKGQ